MHPNWKSTKSKIDFLLTDVENGDFLFVINYSLKSNQLTSNFFRRYFKRKRFCLFCSKLGRWPLPMKKGQIFFTDFPCSFFEILASFSLCFCLLLLLIFEHFLLKTFRLKFYWEVFISFTSHCLGKESFCNFQYKMKYALKFLIFCGMWKWKNGQEVETLKDACANRASKILIDC